MTLDPAAPTPPAAGPRPASEPPQVAGWTRRQALAAALASAFAAHHPLAAALATNGSDTGGAGQTHLTALARLLAGIDSPDDPTYAAETRTPAWQAHRAASQRGAAAVRSRIDRMSSFARAQLPPQGPGSTLVYPFSGPDLINAYALFPDTENFLFFSLERPGSVPDPARLAPGQFSRLLEDLRYALNDLVNLNFFITPNMKAQMHTDHLDGISAVLLAMIGVMDLRAEGLRRIDPFPQRRAAQEAPGGHRPALPLAAIELDFSNPRTGRHHRLQYYSLDVSDAQLPQYPEFLPMLSGIDHPAVLLKAASYLLHGDHFRQVRNWIAERADLVVQDDSGMPYRTLQKAGFEVALLGRYEKPVKLFENRYQKDLESAFAARGERNSLPFPFGYNWRKEGRSGMIVARRPATPPKA